MNWFSTQWQQIRAGGWAVVRRKLRRALKIALNSIWAIPLVAIIRVIRPWLKVRMGTLISERSGHFVADAALYLAHGAGRSRKPRNVDLFWFPEPTSNEQWARMVRRQLSVHWWVKYLIIFNNLIPRGTAHHMPPTHGSRDIDGVLPRSTSRFEFTSAEAARAKAWLRKRGWQDGQPFVCLLVRDSAYLSSHPLHSDGGADFWNYHNHRDTDINAYVETVQALTAKGIWVIRMGKISHQRFPLNHPRIIDYPYVEDQDDLLDVWLSANCSFFVSTGTGIDMLPMIYGLPIVFVNYIPLNQLASFAHSILVPKHMRWSDSGRLLTLKEHLQHDYLSAQRYAEAGIVIEDLKPGEINAAVMECGRRLTGTWVETEQNRVRQIRFWQALAAWPDFHKLHGYIHPESRVGCAWLESMGDDFFA